MDHELAIAIHGRRGRMGQALSELIANEAGVKLTALTGADVIIDFSTAKGLEDALLLARQANIPLVSGTTGLQAAQHDALRQASVDIPVFWAANMSVGMNVLYQLAASAAAILGDVADIEIIERHHRDKRDAPSGSALVLGEHIARASNRPLMDLAVSRGFAGDEQGHVRPAVDQHRQPGEIGFTSVRGGSMPGEHSVLFAIRNETLELTHRVENRQVFAQGALQAARWLVSRQHGLYGYADLLKSLR